MSKSKKVAAPAEAPSTPEPAATVVTQVTHTIDLAPEDRMWAVWEKRELPNRPKPAPFDFEACKKRLAELKKDKSGWVNWQEANIAPDLTRQEAHFWLLALTANYANLSPPTVAERIEKKAVTGKISVADAIKLIKNAKRFSAPDSVLVLFNLFDRLDIAELLQDEDVFSSHLGAVTLALTEFAERVVPHLTQKETKKLKDDLAPLIDVKEWPKGLEKRPPMPFFLAALVGMPEELLAIIQAIPGTLQPSLSWETTYYHQVQRLIFGLGSPQLVESEMRRLKLRLREAPLVRIWLALTQFSGLDYVRESILAEDDKASCEWLMEEFAHVKAPEAAPFMLEFKLNAKGSGPARRWLLEQVANAVTGLVPVAVRHGKLAEAAAEYLREAKMKGHEGLIREALKGVSSDVADSIRKNVLDRAQKEYTLLDEKSTPPDLKVMLGVRSKPGLPQWVSASVLPPILVNDHRLSDEQTTLVLEALRRSALNAADPLVKAVKRHADPASLDNFAWKLFQLWQSEVYPTKERWAMAAIGHFGGDSSVLKITPLIRNWPGESQHPRAVFGLECLRAVGSDTALMQLNGIAQKLEFKGLKQKATDAMEAIAKEKGLTRAQLEDRVVPDCDLDERGNRVFDFGPRQFRFVLGADMKPMIKDSDGKVKTDLPKPGAKDDATKAADAVDAWKLMKKQVKEVVKLQAERLEQAMVIGRRWSVEDFQTLLVKHPMMIHLVRLLLWGGYDASGKLATTFRVTEDQTLADPNDAAFTLKDAAVGLVHPLHLNDAQKAVWGGIFGDYEIVPPFPQLGRSIHRLEKHELTETRLTRYEGVKLPAPSLVFGLENRGWIRGQGMDAGCFDEHTKPFPGSGVTAVVHYEGTIGFGYIDPNETLTFGECYFVAGIRGPSGYARNETAMPLGQVDPIAVSEVLTDLSTLASKAK